MQKFFPEELSLLETVQRFSAEHLAARIDECEAEKRFDRESWGVLSDLGLSGIMVSKEFNGAALRFGLMPSIFEELAKGSTPFTACFLVHSTVSAAIDRIGDQSQKQRFLPGLVSGEKIAALAITEPDAGSDVSSMGTKAVREGNTYRINGQKHFITSGGEAGLYLVFAKTNDSPGVGGITSFIVESDAPGFSVGAVDNKMGHSSSPTSRLFFDDVSVPASHRLGEEGEGFAIMSGALCRSRLLVGVMGLGLAQAALEKALAYSKERKQFGTAIVGFQGIRWMLADMAAQIEAGRRLAEHAALLSEAGEPFAKEASMAKLLGTDAGMRVTTDCVQILGGYGYMKDHPLERYMREAKVLQIVEGTNQIQRELIAKEMIR